MPKGFTPEELEAMRLADEEIERDFRITNEDLRESRALDLMFRRGCCCDNVCTNE